LEIDQKGLVVGGQEGILRRQTRIIYENGVEVAQEPAGEWVAQEPVNEILGYGTRIEVRTLDSPEGTFEYWRKVRMRVTSYTAASSGKAYDHPAYGVTASGLPMRNGIVAVDKSVIPFRTDVYVPGYGRGHAADTGGGINGRWIDLGYSVQDYVSWRGYVDVYYLTPVPEPERINYLIPTWLP
jgi:3D (Asp-Asp-Asp) domain-containing protein